MERAAIQLLGDLANVLDSVNFTDNSTPAQRRALRASADTLRNDLEGYLGGEVTPALLVAYWAGACAEARLNPLTTDEATPQDVLVATIGYIARDLLAGERIE